MLLPCAPPSPAARSPRRSSRGRGFCQRRSCFWLEAVSVNVAGRRRRKNIGRRRTEKNGARTIWRVSPEGIISRGCICATARARGGGQAHRTHVRSQKEEGQILKSNRMRGINYQPSYPMVTQRGHAEQLKKSGLELHVCARATARASTAVFFPAPRHAEEMLFCASIIIRSIALAVSVEVRCGSRERNTDIIL